jgi:hypothetical protein
VFKNLARSGLVMGAGKVPGLRRLPMLKLLAVGEIALLARSHITKLDADERHRFVHLMRKGHGRPKTLSAEEREELSTLAAKAEPRLFAGMAANMLSPVPLPRRVVRGPRRR